MRSKRPIDRRELLKKVLTGGIGTAALLEQLGGVPLFGTWASELAGAVRGDRLDAFHMMSEVLHGGPATLAVAQAMAADDEPWILVDIRVVNHVYTPLVFRAGTTMPSLKVGAAADLKTLGVDTVCADPRFGGKLKFNNWFGNMLINGTADGKAPAGANLKGVGAGDVKNLLEPEVGGKVAFQAYLGLNRHDATKNHALISFKLRKDLADISLFAAEKQLIYSPLGISCFMMGTFYDRAEGSLDKNAVLTESATESPRIDSRPVKAYVNQIRQFVGKSYVDRTTIEQSLIYQMDELVMKEPALRKELLNSRSAFLNLLGDLEGAASLEDFSQPIVATAGNQQSGTAAAGTGAKSEFLAQCLYVARSLELPGKPVRNHSLFLNTVDIDGQPLDFATNNINIPVGGEIRALTYIEGMRQLAMGLNILAKKIADGRKIIVWVHAEGGRDTGMGDSALSFSLVMGPKGAGGLDDHFAAPDDFATRPELAAAGDHKALTDGDVYGKDGSKMDGIKPTTGDVGLGIIEFLEEKAGVQARTALSDDQGRFIKLKRG